MRHNSWPSLRGSTSYPESVPTRRAVYGKVHRAPTDFRWIGWSQGFGEVPPPFERLINFGSDEVAGVSSWRCSAETGPLAIQYYVSRAFDAAGRPTGVEKQILATMPYPIESIPPVALAFLLLPEIAKADDTLWWDSWRDPRWNSQDYFLPLQEDEIITPNLRFDRLEDLFERGLNELLDNVSEENLQAFYSQLISETRPAILRTNQQFLSPLAMAALLLPLDRKRTEEFSIAGGIQAENHQKLTSWDAIVCLPGDHGQSEIFDIEAHQAAGELVKMLKGGRANRGLLPIVYSSGSEFLRAFVDSEDRWFRPGKPGSESLLGLGPWPLVTDSTEAAALRELVAEFLNTVATASSNSHARRQMDVKADLVRALLLVLCPGIESIEVAKLPTTGLVPALYFIETIDNAQLSEFASRYHAVVFEALVANSLRECKVDSLSRPIHEWLVRHAEDGSGDELSQHAIQALESLSAPPAMD